MLTQHGTLGIYDPLYLKFDLPFNFPQYSLSSSFFLFAKSIALVMRWNLSWYGTIQHKRLCAISQYQLKNLAPSIYHYTSEPVNHAALIQLGSVVNTFTFVSLLRWAVDSHWL